VTTTQGDLFADAAIADAERNADSSWLAAARSAVNLLRNTGAMNFTTDEVWEELDRRQVPRPREPRAMGAVMRACVREGLIESSDSYVKSRRPETHSRPIPVWRVVR
jgi:hypothetical protein